MPQITADSIWIPPLFPLAGRLPKSFAAVQANVNLQKREERDYHQQLNAENNRKNPYPCCKSLHISLFFDGTNNNEEQNTAAQPPHPSNIARLYHATPEDNDSGYYRYYMPGVGTPFPQIGELDFSDEGLQFARGGEDRINWALLRIIDALSHTLIKERLRDEDATQLIHSYQALASRYGADPKFVKRNRQNTFANLLAPLRAKVKTYKPTLLKVKLFVFGFSRGAAEARTFVNWLTQILDAELLKTTTERPEILGLPITIEYLGLCDTVASVGFAHIVPQSDGHMGWADASLALPDEAKYPGFIQHCYHFVSAHEQRLCFPLDSIRRTKGNYPARTWELLYPGVHSDVGGGYAPGEQGKSLQDSELLSQIVLHDIYATAFAIGAPLAVPERFLPNDLKRMSPNRVMTGDTNSEFLINESLIERFNAWRSTLVPNSPSSPAETYTPQRLGQPLEQAVAEQMAWITAWRIGRFANGSYVWQPFFIAAKLNSQDEDPVIFNTNKTKRDQRQKETEGKRKAHNLKLSGEPIFEPAKDQEQLAKAANEFRADYESTPLTIGLNRKRDSVWQMLLDDGLRGIGYIYNSDDEAAEYVQMKEAGKRRYEKLFQNPQGKVNENPELANLCALYDDHIHDSRAWFMYSTLGSREFWAGYFRYRMIYSGDYANKEMSLLQMPLEAAKLYIGVNIYSRLSAAESSHKIQSDLENTVDSAKKKAKQTVDRALDAAAEAVKNAVKDSFKDAVNKSIPKIPGFALNNLPSSPYTCQISNIRGKILQPQPVLTEVCAPTHNLAELRAAQEHLDLVRKEQKQESLSVAVNDLISSDDMA